MEISQEKEPMTRGDFHQFEYLGTVHPVEGKTLDSKMIKNSLKKYHLYDPADILLCSSEVIDGGRSVYVRKEANK